MKVLIPTLVMITALAAASMAAELITVEAKFIESSKGSIPHDFEKLAKRKDIDVLSAPRVTTKAGQQTQIECTREYLPASVAPGSFQPVHIGTTIFIRPYLKGDRIAYTARINVSDPVPDKDLDKQTTRVETTSHDLYVSGALKDGDEVWLDFAAPINGKKLVVWFRFKQAVP